MKKIIPAFLLIFVNQIVKAQNGNANPNAQWRINGNSASTTDFMGTTNSQKLIFKTDNIERLQLDEQGKLILNSGKEMIINPGGLIRQENANPISAYMLKVGGSGHFEGEVNTRQLFVQEYITFLKSMKGPRIDIDTIRMDSTRGIFGHTKIFGDVQIKQNLEVLGNATFKNNLTAEKGFTFDGVNGISKVVSDNRQIFRYGNGSAARPTAICANALGISSSGTLIHEFDGILQVYDAATSGTGGLLNIQTWTGGSSIDASNGGNTGSGNLYLNYFCGNDILMCNGQNGGTVFLGNKVSASQSVKIGNDGTNLIDLNTSLTINQNVTGSNALKFKTYNNGLKIMSIENVNFTNSPFTIYGDGNTVINAGYQSLKYFTVSDASGTGIPKESFVVYGNGKTKIGIEVFNTGPHTDALLTVSGKMVARSCYVTQLNWADFVFDKDYKLPKLSDIENYYKINGHLPQIPSEKEVIENGIDLGEMNKLLLQKIEELTILMVHQDKRIKELENKK